MVGRRLRLKFEDKGAGLVAGAAWVTCGGVELTPDCATYSELDCHLRDLEAEIAAIRAAGKREFERCQGKLRSHA